MKKKHYSKNLTLLAIIALGLTLTGCANEQANLNGNHGTVDLQNPQDSLYETPPGYTSSPFEVAELPDAELPESLGGEGVSGQMILRVALDSAGDVVHTDIVRLRISDSGGGSLISYHNTLTSLGTEYPEDKITLCY